MLSFANNYVDRNDYSEWPQFTGQDKFDDLNVFQNSFTLSLVTKFVLPLVVVVVFVDDDDDNHENHDDDVGCLYKNKKAHSHPTACDRYIHVCPRMTEERTKKMT